MIVPVAGFMALFFGFVVAKALAMRHLPPRRDRRPIVGREGVVLAGGLDPEGVVRVAAEEWRATIGNRLHPRRIEDPCHQARRARAHRRTARTSSTRQPAASRRPEEGTPDGLHRPGVHRRCRRRSCCVILFLANAIRIVPEYQRLVVFRLGRLLGVKGPGLVILIPIVDKGVKVDLREFFLEIPRQDSITKDNAPIAVDFITFYKVVDPSMSVVQVGNFAGAAQALASTTLRAVIGDIPLDDVLAKRDEINQILRAKLDEVTERWGVKVTNVEIREIIPPPSVQEAMTRQMSAERSRRAIVLEADGTKSAAITVAEGNKASAILNAEGSKASAILTAEGERQAAILRAEGVRARPRRPSTEQAIDRRPEDDEPAVSRRAQADRRLARIEDRRADGALRPRRRDRGGRRPGEGRREGAGRIVARR